MRKFIFLSILVAIGYILCCSADAQAQEEKALALTQHRVPIVNIRPRMPRLESHKYARIFRTNLRNAAKKGINFAGRFVISFWGHGASNVIAAITDAKTGKVFFPKQLFNFWSDEWPGTGIPFWFQANSRLLVMKGYESNDYLGPQMTYGLHYYVWTGSRLRQIRFDKMNSENNGN